MEHNSRSVTTRLVVGLPLIRLKLDVRQAELSGLVSSFCWSVARLRNFTFASNRVVLSTYFKASKQFRGIIEFMHLNDAWTKEASGREKINKKHESSRGGNNNKTSSLHTSHHGAQKSHSFLFLVFSATRKRRVVNLCLTVFISNKFVNHFFAPFISFYCRRISEKKSSRVESFSLLSAWMAFCACFSRSSSFRSRHQRTCVPA